MLTGKWPIDDTERIVQTKATSNGPAAITTKDGRVYFYLEFGGSVEKRELDKDDSYAMDRIAEWVVATTRLSKHKQEMRVPTQCVMRAVGTGAEDIDLFLGNEGKNGLSGRLRQLEWYQTAHHEIKTAILKLFAHLGLFGQQKIDGRMEIVGQVAACFSLLEIHNLFGGLPPGTSLKKLLGQQDVSQGVDPSVRKMYDPNGKKAIAFFLKNMHNADFKEVACYALTHYVSEYSAYNAQKRTSAATLESTAAISDNPEVVEVANAINAKHNEVADALYERQKNGASRVSIKELQDQIEGLRAELARLITTSDDAVLKRLLGAAELSKMPFAVSHIEASFDSNTFSDEITPEIAESAKRAGYRSSDEGELKKLCRIYEEAKRAPRKCFEMTILDTARSKYHYKWLSSSDPDLYTIGMSCGNTCMRPGFAGEAALLESALSSDVAMAAILDDNDKIVAYFRVNYDDKGQGFYVDTVESRFSYVLNNGEIWLTVERAVVDMAKAMNAKGTYPVRVVNFREERGNRLKVQWDCLAPAKVILAGRSYSHPMAPWPYGDDNPRVQKEIWASPVRSPLCAQSLSSCEASGEPLGEGATGAVYQIGEARVIKVFPSSYPIEEIENEFRQARIFYENGIPSPEPFEIVDSGRGIGIVSERIYGSSLTHVIKSNPVELDRLIGEMIGLMRSVHSIQTKGSQLTSAKEKYLGYLKECKGYYTSEDYVKLKTLIEAIPDRKTLLHGDFHTNNIMVTEAGRMVVIDFAEVCYGHPIFDIIAEGAVIPVTLENEPKLAESYLGAPVPLLRKIWSSYIRHYFNLTNETEAETIGAKAKLLSRIRNAITAAITHGIPEPYLIKCAESTHSLLIPEVNNLLKTDWGLWE